MNKMIKSLENDQNVAEDLKDVKVNKRLTVDFMGMQVSYPQYLRLVKLQEKVVKLNQVSKIKKLPSNIVYLIRITDNFL